MIQHNPKRNPFLAVVCIVAILVYFAIVFGIAIGAMWLLNKLLPNF
jgi:uncharacterized membrane protein (DUF485 family)